MEFEWKILPGFTTAAILKETQNKMGELQCDPADFIDRIIFMSMFNDIEWETRGNEELCEHNTACEENVQLLLKMVMSVNQLSLHGAIVDMIQGLPEDQVAPGRLVASDQTEQEILIQPARLRAKI